MTTTEAKDIIIRLRNRAYVDPCEIALWLMDSKSRLAFDKNNFSVHDAEKYVYTSDVIEYYTEGHHHLAKAIGHCWEADKHAALMVIERLMALLEYNYEGCDVNYNQLLTKLNLMRFIMEYSED